jgi:SLOG cluster4 family
MRRICVFSGSNLGHRSAYREAAAALGGLLAREGIGLVYGGAAIGLMGAMADAARTAGGEVIGVIPQSLVEREVAHRVSTTFGSSDRCTSARRSWPNLYGAFPVKWLFWVLLRVLCSEREGPFFVPSPAIRFPERAEGVKGPKR